MERANGARKVEKKERDPFFCAAFSRSRTLNRHRAVPNIQSENWNFSRPSVLGVFSLGSPRSTIVPRARSCTHARTRARFSLARKSNNVYKGGFESKLLSCLSVKERIKRSGDPRAT